MQPSIGKIDKMLASANSQHAIVYPGAQYIDGGQAGKEQRNMFSLPGTGSCLDIAGQADQPVTLRCYAHFSIPLFYLTSWYHYNKSSKRGWGLHLGFDKVVQNALYISDIVLRCKTNKRKRESLAWE